MSATAGSAAGQHGLIDKLGIDEGAVVQEIGWDDDCDEALRQVILTQRLVACLLYTSPSPRD